MRFYVCDFAFAHLQRTRDIDSYFFPMKVNLRKPTESRLSGMSQVWTRGPREIRGYCIGFLIAFDKHWNLALEDVLEVWTRRVKRKTVLLGEMCSIRKLIIDAKREQGQPPASNIEG
ncbi:hypothetical protein RUM44_012759 [Polyplax serrata]|uniref:Sm domain-containing protein n=1 Tax=Polyplax serrata TaxID=468196 RepID=A0ABR1BGK4_POLSC